MVSTEDVPCLLSTLCRSFLCSSTPFYLTKLRKKQLEQKGVSQLKRKVFDCLLFDYVEELSPESAQYHTKQVKYLVTADEYGIDTFNRFHNAIDAFSSPGNEEKLKILSFLLPLAHSVKRDYLPVLGYGNLPPMQVLSRDMLDEEEIFQHTPLLAPSDSRQYTYYPQSLFSDSVVTVADSAFSEIASSCDSEPFSHSNFPISDPLSYCQLPSTTDGSYYFQAVDNERLVKSTSDLYGALTNSYVCNDLQSFLELPPIDIAPVLFGYGDSSSSASNKTEGTIIGGTSTGHFRSDSGFGGDLIEDAKSEDKKYLQPMSWELKRRCGGLVGCDIKEKPYLTEAGPEVFDVVYRLQLSCQLQIEPMNRREAKRHLYVISMADLMTDISLLLVGVSSQCFSFDQRTESFTIKQGLVVSGLSSQALAGVCEVLIDAGTYYYRLNKLSEVQFAGLTVAAFLRSISQYLSTYTAALLDMTTKAKSRSPQYLRLLLKKQLQQISLLAKLCHCSGPVLTEYPPEDLPQGIHLLSYIYIEAEKYNYHHTYHLMLSLLHDTSKPYLRFLQDWVFQGCCSDPYEEFTIIVDPFKLDAEDRSYWTDGYLPDQARNSKCLFIGNLSDKIFIGGKSLALLRRIVPDHDILMVKNDVPNLDICLTEEQQQDVSAQSAVYIETVKAMVKHKIYTRKIMIEEKEQKRVEVIRQAQALQAQRLAAIYKRINEHQQKVSQKKRKIYNELKDNMEAVAARKTREEKEEKAQDRELVERLTKREQLQTESDVKLEQQAREELIEYYRLMSETAALRERKALWRVRRHQLSAAREKWHSDRQLELANQLQQLGSADLDFVAAKRKWAHPEQLVMKVGDEDEEKNIGEDNILTSDNHRQSVPATLESPNSQADLPAADNLVKPLDARDEVDAQAARDEVDTVVAKHSTIAEEAAVNETLILPSATDYSLPPVSAEHTLPCTTIDHTFPSDAAELTLLSATSDHSILSTHLDVTKHIEDILSSSPLPLYGLAQRRSTKSVEGTHTSMTTFDRDFLVCRSIRRSDPNRIIQEEVEVAPHKSKAFHISSQSDMVGDALDGIRRRRPVGTRMIASAQSEEADWNVVRLEKFRVINKRGHASHSSIQELMYYGNTQEDSIHFEETALPPVEPIKLQDIPEDLSPYEKDYQAEYVKRPSWLSRTHSGDEVSSRREGVSLYEHVSLSTLLHQSIASTISAQISLSNQAALSYFMVELEFDRHMDILHNYLLLAKGEFCQAFTSPLFDKLHSSEEHRPPISTYFLTHTLSKALQHAPLKDNPFTENVTITKGKVPRFMETYTLNAFSWLSLTYKVPWPMNILITAEQVSMYERIFSFMISLKHISYLLADSWHSLKLSTHTHSIDSESQQFRQLHLIRHDMQHFVKVIHGYLALQVTQVSWHQFQTELKTSVTDLDSLYESHSRFISRCLSRCFLSHKVQQIKQVVDGILKSIYKFHALLRLGHWELNENEEFIHTEYEDIVKAYLPFKEFTQFLNKVLTRMTEFDKNQHLRELQIMLNFNGYYNRSILK